MVFSQGFALFRSYVAWFQTKTYVYYKDYAPLGLLCFQFNFIYPYVIDYLKLHNFSLTAMGKASVEVFLQALPARV